MDQVPERRVHHLGRQGQSRQSRDLYLPGHVIASQLRKDRVHITQKPIDVMLQLVRICPEDGTVLDPFIGSDSTGSLRRRLLHSPSSTAGFKPLAKRRSTRPQHLMSTLLRGEPTEGKSMAKKRGRQPSAHKRRNLIIGWSVLLLLLIVVFRSAVWPYLLGAVVVGALGCGAWWLRRTDRLVRERDRQWRQQDAIRAGHRTLAKVDKMSGTEFEDLVAKLCRRDGCTEIRRVGGAGDNGADVTGCLPDGRTMVIQCKRYAPSATIPARDLRDLLGSKAHFGADLAVFVTTTRFSRQALAFAVKNGILAIHRDHFGLWNSGASLISLSDVNGSGQGNSQHRAVWKRTYVKPHKPRSPRGL